MADLQVYQYDSTKLPYESKTYTTPDMGDGSKVRMVAFIDKDDMNDVPDRVYKYGTY